MERSVGTFWTGAAVASGGDRHLALGAVGDRDNGDQHLSCPRLQDGIADQFRDLWDYGISECGKPTFIHLSGNPISHKDKAGGANLTPVPHCQICGTCICRPSCLERFNDVRTWLLKKSPSTLHGVGHKPDTFSAMGSAQGRSRYIFPLRIIPDGGQVSENSAKPFAWLFSRASKQICDVLNDDEQRSKVASKSDDLGPQPASRSFAHTTLQTGCANVLARKPAGNDVNGNSIGSQSVCGKFSHVSVAGDVGPMLCKDTAGKLLYFAKGDGFKTARALKAKREAAYAAKKIEDAQHLESRVPCEGNRRDQDNASHSRLGHGVKVLHAIPLFSGQNRIGQIGWCHAASPWAIDQKSEGNVTPRSAARRAIAWRYRHGMLREGSRQLATAPGETFRASATVLLPPNWSRM